VDPVQPPEGFRLSLPRDLVLKVGEELRITVIEDASEGTHARIRVKGFELRAMTEVALTKGQMIRARVTELQPETGKVQLTSLGTGAQAVRGGVEISAGRALAAAALRAGVELSAQTLQADAVRVERHPGRKLEAARLIAMLHERHLEPSLLDEILGALPGPHSQTRDEQDHPSPRRHPAHQGRAEHRLPHRQLVDKTVEGLKETLGAGADTGTHPLQLFNHVRSSDGQWLLFPFEMQHDSKQISAVLRLYVPYARGEPTIVVLNTERDDGARLGTRFRWSGASARNGESEDASTQSLPLTLFANFPIPERALRRLDRAISSYNLRVALPVRAMAEFDGFSVHEESGIIFPTDKMV